jgi:hypothetical protein
MISIYAKKLKSKFKAANETGGALHSPRTIHVFEFG